MTYINNYKTCNISCNWSKIVNYNFPSCLVDFALCAATERAIKLDARWAHQKKEKNLVSDDGGFAFNAISISVLQLQTLLEDLQIQDRDVLQIQ